MDTHNMTETVGDEAPGVDPVPIAGAFDDPAWWGGIGGAMERAREIQRQIAEPGFKVKVCVLPLLATSVAANSTATIEAKPSKGIFYGVRPLLRASATPESINVTGITVGGDPQIPSSDALQVDAFPFDATDIMLETDPVTPQVSLKVALSNTTAGALTVRGGYYGVWKTKEN